MSTELSPALIAGLAWAGIGCPPHWPVEVQHPTRDAALLYSLCVLMALSFLSGYSFNPRRASVLHPNQTTPAVVTHARREAPSYEVGAAFATPGEEYEAPGTGEQLETPPADTDNHPAAHRGAEAAPFAQPAPLGHADAAAQVDIIPPPVAVPVDGQATPGTVVYDFSESCRWVAPTVDRHLANVAQRLIAAVEELLSSSIAEEGFNSIESKLRESLARTLNPELAGTLATSVDAHVKERAREVRLNDSTRNITNLKNSLGGVPQSPKKTQGLQIFRRLSGRGYTAFSAESYQSASYYLAVTELVMGMPFDSWVDEDLLGRFDAVA